MIQLLTAQQKQKNLQVKKLVKSFLLQQNNSWQIPVLLAFSLIFLSSCQNEDLSKSGRLTFHNNGEIGGFIFTVSDKFNDKHKDSPADEYNPKMTAAESELLAKLLKQSKYCQSDKTPPFVITSKQEKIYDMTFAHLIEENYNARPIAPKTYFGQCRSK